MLSRRQFLGVAGVSSLSLAGAMPKLFAQAGASAARADRNNHVLVVVELAGGNDGLNTVIPFENDKYHKLRPTLRIAKDAVVKVTDQIGLHPALAPAGELFKSGKLAIVQGVGYPEPNRSHFRSMEIWHTASTAGIAPTTGWLGRVLDDEFAGDGDRRLGGLALTNSLPQAFQADRASVPAIQQLEAFVGQVNDPRQMLVRKLNSMPGAGDDGIGFVRRQSSTLFAVTEQIRAAAARYKAGVEYPANLGPQLRQAVQVINADLGTRLLFVSQDGYDTHNQQGPAHQNLLTELAGSLAAFQQDLEKHELAERVIVMVFSEFGRRVDENASHGTDHGAASCMFLSGSNVKAGLAGAYPSLDKLGDGDLIHTVDFRSVYATLLEKWLGCPAEKLLGGKFPELDLIAT